MLQSDACTAANLPSLRAPDGDTNEELCEFLPLMSIIEHLRQILI